MVLKNIPSILRLQADNFTHNAWGGNWLPGFKKLAKGKLPVGESWEFSGHPGHPSHLKLFTGADIDLPSLINSYPKDILGENVLRKFGKRAPFLLKFIDARKDLSLQVHPSDAYAKKYERDSGKAESWVILSTGQKKGEGFLYLGFNPQFARRYGSREELKMAFDEALKKGKAAGILPFLNKIRVRPGEAYDLKPGTIHAIGRGIRLFEIQQTSDITYRVWDWNRKPKRPLHEKKAADVIEFIPQKPDAFRFKKRHDTLLVNKEAGFAVDQILISRKDKVVSHANNNRFSVLTVLEGEIIVRVKEGLRVTTGCSVLIPAFVKRYELKSETEKAVVLKSYVPG